MQLPLALHRRPSRSYFGLLASGHVLAGVAVCLLPVPGWLRALAVIVLALLFVRTWRGILAAPDTLLLRSDGHVDFIAADGSTHEAEVTRDTVVLPWVVVLHATGVPPQVIFPDGLSDPDGHRQLRLWLRWRSVPSPQPPSQGRG